MLFSKKTTREKMIMKRLQEHYNYLVAAGYQVVAVILQGSQNYNLDEYSDEYMSDIDSKAIVLPTLAAFLKGTAPVSTTIILENNEHIDVKDIRIMCDMWRKCNISYIELLYSKFYIVNRRFKREWNALRGVRDLLIEPSALARCIVGMMFEKQKALCHPYPATKDKVEKYGYDGKQLSHAVRLLYFMRKWLDGRSIEECYDATDDRWELMALKKQCWPGSKEVLPLKIAIAAMDAVVEEGKELRNKVEKQDEDDILLDGFSYACLEKGVKKWKF